MFCAIWRLTRRLRFARSLWPGLMLVLVAILFSNCFDWRPTELQSLLAIRVCQTRWRCWWGGIGGELSSIVRSDCSGGLLPASSPFAECVQWLPEDAVPPPPLPPPPSQCICSFVLPPACQSHSCQPSPCVPRKSTQTEHATVTASQFNVYSVHLLILCSTFVVRNLSHVFTIWPQRSGSVATLCLQICMASVFCRSCKTNVSLFLH